MFESPNALIIEWLTLPGSTTLKSELAKCNQITHQDTQDGKWVVVKCFDDDKVLENIVDASNSFRHQDLYSEGYTEVNLQNSDGVAYRVPLG